MKNIIMLFFIVGLIGCQKAENKTKEIVLSSLKDPNSAQFQNVKGYCGEVNAKNGFGGYIGFKRFYVSGNQAVFETEDNLLDFENEWRTRCISKQSLSQKEISSCEQLADYASSVVLIKESGGTKGSVIDGIKESKHKDMYYPIINEVFYDQNITDNEEYATNILNRCLRKEAIAP